MLVNSNSAIFHPYHGSVNDEVNYDYKTSIQFLWKVSKDVFLDGEYLWYPIWRTQAYKTNTKKCSCMITKMGVFPENNLGTYFNNGFN